MRQLLSKIAIVALIGVLTNCSKDAVITCSKVIPATTISAVPQAQLATDQALITKYLSANSITNAQVDANSGMKYVIKVTGSGDTPCLQSAVSVQYSGRILQSNGTLAASTFDASSAPVTYVLSKLILGWQIGFLDLPKGSTATLYIPSGYAYGVEGASTKIPSNAVLVFEVQLLDFQ